MTFLRVILKVVGVAVILFAIGYIVATNFLFSESVDGVTKDGLGRVLFSPPTLIRGFTGIRQWPGLWWYVFDWVLSVASLLIGVALLRWRDR